MDFINIDNLTSIGNRLYCPMCTKVDHVGTGRYCKEEDIVWLKKKEGKYGKFAGCPNFPKCKYSVSLERKEYYIDYEDELRPY